MINDDTIIKFIRKVRGYREEWPEKVILFKERLEEMKRGFPGLGNSHLSIESFNNIKVGDIFIIDNSLEKKIRDDSAPLMLEKTGPNSYDVQGIGYGLDLIRDPDRTKIRWGDTISLAGIEVNDLVIKVDVRPTLNGGPGYYYFFKSYRDFRF